MVLLLSLLSRDGAGVRQAGLPNSEPLVGTLQAFGIFAVGFLARPIGAFIFGHYGDRIGRKSTLIATLLLMGLSTFAVALVPTYDSIGIWGAVLLTALRFIQGVGVGGEWGGSVLLAMEWAKTSAHRGFIASWPQFGVPTGRFLANLAVLGFSALSGDAFLEWGWRVPFLLNIVLMFIGLYIRLRIFETPAFARLAEQGNISRAPVIEVLRRYPREVLLTAASRLVQHAAFYIFTAFIFTYGTQTLGVSRDFLLGAVMTASVVSLFTIPFFGWLSDRIGRKRMYAIGNVALGAFGFVYFALLDTGAPAWIFFAIVISMIPHDMVYGPQAAMIAECFPARLRYSGASLGYHLASVVAVVRAADRGGAVGAVRLRLCGRRLYFCIRHREPSRDVVPARLHKQGYLGTLKTDPNGSVCRLVLANSLTTKRQPLPYWPRRRG